MLNFTTIQAEGIMDWLKRPLPGREDDKPTAEAEEYKTCYLRGGPCDGTELQVEDCPTKVRVEKRYTVTAPQAEAFGGALTRTHRYRMIQPCSDGFIYVYDGSE